MLHAFYLFYVKIFIPSILIAILIALSYLVISGVFSPHLIGYSYFFLAIGFHLVLYDLNHPAQYYFYYNLGISKMDLWAGSIIASLIISTILFVI